jgi:hypothetical protein
MASSARDVASPILDCIPEGIALEVVTETASETEFKASCDFTTTTIVCSTEACESPKPKPDVDLLLRHAQLQEKPE